MKQVCHAEKRSGAAIHPDPGWIATPGFVGLAMTNCGQSLAGRPLRTLTVGIGRFAAVILQVVALAAPAAGDEVDRGGEIRFTAGVTGILDNDRDATARIEYHFDKELLPRITPYLSAGIATDGSSLFGGGLAYRLPLGEHWRITLASGPAYYDQNGGANLGYELEFVSYAEIATEVAPGFWMGLNVGHISNAGLGKVNPGREIVGITYSFRPRKSRARTEDR